MKSRREEENSRIGSLCSYAVVALHMYPTRQSEQKEARKDERRRAEERTAPRPPPLSARPPG